MLNERSTLARGVVIHSIFVLGPSPSVWEKFTLPIEIEITYVATKKFVT